MSLATGTYVASFGVTISKWHHDSKGKQRKARKLLGDIEGGRAETPFFVVYPKVA
jgi:hypothetical protein